MEIKIEETGKIEELTVIDAKSGQDWVQDLIGNSSDSFDYDTDIDAFIMTQEQYDWWSDYCNRHEAADHRFYGLIKSASNGDYERFWDIRVNLDFDMDTYPEQLDALCDAMVSEMAEYNR